MREQMRTVVWCPRDITEFPAQAFDTISIIGTQLYKYQRKYQQFYRARP